MNPRLRIATAYEASAWVRLWMVTCVAAINCGGLYLLERLCQRLEWSVGSWPGLLLLLLWVVAQACAVTWLVVPKRAAEAEVRDAA